MFCFDGKSEVTDHTEGHAGSPRASTMNGDAGELPPSAQVQLRRVQLQPGALAEGAVPGLPVTWHARRLQGPGLPVRTFELPAQVYRERDESGRFALDVQNLTRDGEGERGGMDGEGWRF